MNKKDLRINTNIPDYKKRFEELIEAIKEKKGITRLHVTDLMRLLIDDGVKKYVK